MYVCMHEHKINTHGLCERAQPETRAHCEKYNSLYIFSFPANIQGARKKRRMLVYVCQMCLYMYIRWLRALKALPEVIQTHRNGHDMVWVWVCVDETTAHIHAHKTMEFRHIGRPVYEFESIFTRILLPGDDPQSMRCFEWFKRCNAWLCMIYTVQWNRKIV